eukprot:m.219892 g.219892  ORF g.219892 m.219892 type:complete len:352 (-) comp25766_c0_seq3:822-1877(-)
MASACPSSEMSRINCSCNSNPTAVSASAYCSTDNKADIGGHSTLPASSSRAWACRSYTDTPSTARNAATARAGLISQAAQSPKYCLVQWGAALLAADARHRRLSNSRLYTVPRENRTTAPGLPTSSPFSGSAIAAAAGPAAARSADVGVGGGTARLPLATRLRAIATLVRNHMRRRTMQVRSFSTLNVDWNAIANCQSDARHRDPSFHLHDLIADPGILSTMDRSVLRFSSSIDVGVPSSEQNDGGSICGRGRAEGRESDESRIERERGCERGGVGLGETWEWDERCCFFSFLSGPARCLLSTRTIHRGSVVVQLDESGSVSLRGANWRETEPCGAEGVVRRRAGGGQCQE